MADHEIPEVETDKRWQWKIWNISIVAAIAMAFLIIMRYLLWRKKYSQLIPGRNVRFFSILGNLSDLPFSAKARNGYTLNVFLLMLFEAYSKLLNDAPLFCFWFFCSPIVVLYKTEAIEAFVNDTKMLDKGWFYNWTQPVLGSGLLTRGMELIIDRLWNILHWSDFIYSLTRNGKEMKKIIETSENFTRTIIRETKEKYFNGELKIGDEKQKSLMEVLLEHHLQTKELSEEDIREEVITFTIAGHHSSATSLIWTLYLIGLHKEVQAKIQTELDWIFGENQERPASNEDLKEMKYLESVIKESLRLFPSVYFFARHISEDIKICNYTIPKGSTCVMMPYLVHRDEKVFNNPEKFNPDRFSPENLIKYNSNSYIPFAAGPRNCIGQVFALIEEKIILSTLLRNYSFESLEPRDRLPPTVDIVLKPSKPIEVKIRARTKTS
ncbi:unnamed protein product [Larinioides sclopetarius]|uniref:Cytochrome P450 n=1 Tax=Larinioides sclopetarius TaxID=280406 RepID=A0AAV2BQS6_9ARAC